MFFNLWARLSYFLQDFALYIFLLFVSFSLLIFASIKIYKSQFTLFRKKLFITLLFTAFSLILFYSFIEAYFRYVYDVPDGLGFLKVNKKWHERHVVYNNYFFRDRNFETDKKEGTTRIGVLGDSITLGGGIENVEDRFTNILEKKLKDAGKNVEVYNLGKSGYDTAGEIKEYEKVRHLKFDILIWEYFINDVQPTNSTGTPIIEKNSQKGKVVSFFSDRSYLFDYVYWRFSAKYQKTFQELKTADIAQYKNQEVLNEHKAEIAEFVKTLKQDNTKTVVIIFPSILLLGPDYPNYVHGIVLDIFKQNAVEVFIDLLPDLVNGDRSQLIASQFDPHPSEIVHTLAAEKLKEQIMPLLK